MPPEATFVIDITYLGELNHDAEVDGVRFTISTTIAPRYGSYPHGLAEGYQTTTSEGGFKVTVDARLSHGHVFPSLTSRNLTGKKYTQIPSLQSGIFECI